MVAPPHCNVVMDIWGNNIGINGALIRVEELRQTIHEMEPYLDRFRMRLLISMADYEYYRDELENLEAQLVQLNIPVR